MNTAADPNGFLLRFLDGPLAGKGNLESLAGTHDMNVSSLGWTWPLPQRLGVLAHLAHTSNVAMWDADGDGDGLPEEIWRSPRAIVYRKVMESQLPVGSSHVMRGAEYELER